MPSQDRARDAEEQAPNRSQQPPNAGGGRQFDPPADDAISVRDIKAVPNYNSTLGTANYQANMRLMNGDPDWTAAQVCIDVHFRDRAKIFIDVHQKGCLEGLKPLDDRTTFIREARVARSLGNLRPHPAEQWRLNRCGLKGTRVQQVVCERS